MSEPQTPGVAGDAAAGGPVPALTPDAIEVVLADFRDWLRDNARPEEAPPEPEPVDLHTLVAQFTALRQEVNLQTRAVRQQQEQTGEALRQYAESVRLLEGAAGRAVPAATDDERVRALLNALIDVADTQQRAAAEMARVAQGVKAVMDAEASLLERPAAESLRPTLVGRLLGVGRIAEQQRRLVEDLEARLNQRLSDVGYGKGLEQLHQRVEAAASGLAMGLQRIERVMSQHGLEPILAVGRPFDPERMEAVEVTPADGRAPGEVVEEVRRGYLLNGRVLRYAQVRVAK